MLERFRHHLLAAERAFVVHAYPGEEWKYGSDLGRKWTYHDLIDVYVVWLFNRELDGAADPVRSDCRVAIGLHALARNRIADRVGELRCDHTRIHAGATDFVAFLPQPLGDRSHGKLRRGVEPKPTSNASAPRRIPRSEPRAALPAPDLVLGLLPLESIGRLCQSRIEPDGPET